MAGSQRALSRADEPLGCVIASSVVRSAFQGSCHGGIFLVDLDQGTCRLQRDWDDLGIEWAGRGADRGLRGIAFLGSFVIIAASTALLVFDERLRLIDRKTSPHLKHCHEVATCGDQLFVTSTGYDALISFDADDLTPRRGWRFSRRDDGWEVEAFDPTGSVDLLPGDTLHLNSVFADGSRLLVSGLNHRTAWELVNDELRERVRIPVGTHNVQRWDGLGWVFNDTQSNRLAVLDDAGGLVVDSPVPEAAPTTAAPLSDHARPRFARGLCRLPGTTLFAQGSSPARVAVHDLAGGGVRRLVPISADVRNAMHGLKAWPFG